MLKKLGMASVGELVGDTTIVRSIDGEVRLLRLASASGSVCWSSEACERDLQSERARVAARVLLKRGLREINGKRPALGTHSDATFPDASHEIPAREHLSTLCIEEDHRSQALLMERSATQSALLVVEHVPACVTLRCEVFHESGTVCKRGPVCMAHNQKPKHTSRTLRARRISTPALGKYGASRCQAFTLCAPKKPLLLTHRLQAPRLTPWADSCET